jgi:hypothetical protein
MQRTGSARRRFSGHQNSSGRIERMSAGRPVVASGERAVSGVPTGTACHRRHARPERAAMRRGHACPDLVWGVCYHEPMRRFDLRCRLLHEVHRGPHPTSTPPTIEGSPPNGVCFLTAASADRRPPTADLSLAPLACLGVTALADAVRLHRELRTMHNAISTFGLSIRVMVSRCFRIPVRFGSPRDAGMRLQFFFVRGSS